MLLPPLNTLILFENQQMLVVDKPAGLLVHPVAADSVALTAALTAYNPTLRPAHRLDRETSGCVLCGKGPQALRQLGQMFMQRRIGKTYLARLAERLPTPRGTLRAPLLKVKDKMVVDDSGAESETMWEERADGLVALTPLTGRTHQLRVHMAHLGCPIVGDAKYDGPAAPRLMLHAWRLEIPGLGLIEAPLPF